MSSKRKNTDGPKVTMEYAKADVDAGIEGPFLGTNLVSYSFSPSDNSSTTKRP
jgi:hypothetical protein